MSGEKISITIDKDLEDLIPGFLENRNKDISSLRKSLNAGDAENLRALGHNLKGVGGGYGFDEISQLGAEIEAKAKSGTLEGIDSLIESMADYLERIEIQYE